MKDRFYIWTLHSACLYRYVIIDSSMTHEDRRIAYCKEKSHADTILLALRTADKINSIKETT